MGRGTWEMGARCWSWTYFSPQGVEPGVWATVLAVVWLHSRSAAQREEWELLEIKAVGWLRSRAGERAPTSGTQGPLT